VRGYTRKSSEEGLEQQFNSLHAQREAAEAYIKSQRHDGWRLLAEKYDDGGYSGGNLERPGLKRLVADIRAGKVQTVVVYKVDRLTRSLNDFAKLIELFEARGVTFVSVTQQFEAFQFFLDTFEYALVAEQPQTFPRKLPIGAEQKIIGAPAP
jgi:site-specific DNA recombinase